MADPFTDRYWIEEFEVTEADLSRIADHMREESEAHDLTALARRVVRTRLRYGSEEESVPAQAEWLDDAAVRLWDPADEWEEGDHVIGTHFLTKGVYEVVIGEVVGVDSAKVKVKTEQAKNPVVYERADPGSPTADKWRSHVQKEVAKKRQAATAEERAEAVLLTHGRRTGSQLLQALRLDERFVRLAGRWFLRDLAVPATDEQLASLAWAMLTLEEPKSTADLVDLVEPPLADGDPGLFGLYLAMRDSDLFKNADPGKRPRWVLDGPPPGTCTPQHAAYDPESYEVLCLPGEPISPQVVAQLWQLDLLRAVVGSS